MNRRTLLSLFALLIPTGPVFAQPTAFTYQGRLNGTGGAATGLYDFSFNLYAASSGGSPLTASNGAFAVAVSNGLFTATLNFGNQFTGADRWLEIAVRTNGLGGYATLSNRQFLASSPYAIRAGSAGTATTATTANGVAAGAVTLAGLASGAVDSSKIADGTIVANDLSSTLLSGVFWRLTGNAGTTPVVNFVGTTDNQAFEAKVNGQRALRLEPGTTANLIGGFSGNSVPPGIVGASIGGGGAAGFPNRVNATYGTVAGGLGNSVFHNDSFIGAGIGNSISSDRAVIAGGRDNAIETNSANSAVVGGRNNRIDPLSEGSVIAGGQSNLVRGFNSTVSGGVNNSIISASRSVIGGGQSNQLSGGTSHATIAGGFGNRMLGLTSESTIGGGGFNTITFDVPYATIAGGQSNFISGESRSGVIGGGEDNAVGARSQGGTVGGGVRNSTGAYADVSTIGGGSDNSTGLYCHGATIGGGRDNAINGTAIEGSPNATISGGVGNRIESFASSSAVGGGSGNQIAMNSRNATIAGGEDNRASAPHATVPGGSLNVAAGQFSFAAGRRAQASHDGAFVWADSQDADFASTTINQFSIRAAGGVRLSADTPSLSFDDDASSIIFPPSSGANAPMMYLFRSGLLNAPRMVLAHSPAFANWGLQYEDTLDKFHFVSTGVPVMTVDLGNLRVGIGASNPTAKFTVLGSALGGFVNPLVYIENTNTVGNSGPALRVKGAGDPLDGVLSVSSHGVGLIARFGNANAWVSSLDTNGNWSATTFNPSSDRNLKENFAPVNPREILDKVAALPISGWNYKQDPGSKHIGPMAQDFRAAFGTGMDEKHIATVDADGVALAAIQGLNEKLEEQRAENAELKQQLAELRKLVESMARKLD